MIAACAELDPQTPPGSLNSKEVLWAIGDLFMISRTDPERELYEARLKARRDATAQQQFARDEGLRGGMRGGAPISDPIAGGVLRERHHAAGRVAIALLGRTGKGLVAFAGRSAPTGNLMRTIPLPRPSSVSIALVNAIWFERWMVLGDRLKSMPCRSMWE